MADWLTNHDGWLDWPLTKIYQLTDSLTDRLADWLIKTHGFIDHWLINSSVVLTEFPTDWRNEPIHELMNERVIDSLRYVYF